MTFGLANAATTTRYCVIVNLFIRVEDQSESVIGGHRPGSNARDLRTLHLISLIALLFIRCRCERMGFSLHIAGLFIWWTVVHFFEHICFFWRCSGRSTLLLLLHTISHIFGNFLLDSVNRQGPLNHVMALIAEHCG